MADFIVCIAYAPRPNSALGPWVALVGKNAPAWQAGKLNGPGGELSGLLGDSAAEHFEEETGLTTVAGAWSLLATLVSGSDTLYVMRQTLAQAFELNESGPEPATWAANNNLPPGVVPYLKWLIPMGLDPNFTLAEDIDYALEGSP